MANGLDAGPIQTIINMKEQLPEIIKIDKELSEFIKRENINADPASNLASAYQGAQYRAVTSMR